MQQELTINCNGQLLNLTRPIAMGIINVTPDSFYSKSRYNQEEDVITRTNDIINEGGSIIDVGANSSRPGAAHISQQEELTRLDTVLSAIKREFSNAIISVDTFRSKVAEHVVNKYEVSIINDISGGDMDGEMFKTIARLNVGYVLMHMQGTPQTMQQNPTYSNVTTEVVRELSEKIDQLSYLGVKDVIIDPGFGFGKTIDQNFELLSHLDQFQLFKRPILTGLSRKSLIYKTLNTNAENALNGTTVLNTIALEKGASILRVHDVREAMDCIKLANKLKLS